MAFNPEGWSAHNPNMKLAWGSSSLANMMTCPRKYQLENLEGYHASKVDLEFGGLAASSFEKFQKARIGGKNKEDALIEALHWVLKASWDDDGPWGGYYEDQWHCKGEVKYKNSKGNAAKCPYSHKGVFFPAPAPHICGECGSDVETLRNYVPGHNTKNRETLLRLVAWYCLDQPENPDDGLHPYVFPNGTPAVELSVVLPLPWSNRYGEPYILSIHLDQIGVFGDELWVVDQKTTTKGLDEGFWKGYSPSVQFDTYDMAAKAFLPDLDIKGVLLDGAQALVGGARFGRHPFYKTDAMREEHMLMIKFWIDLAEQMAETYGDGDWPQNKASCYLCPFKKICSMDPSERKRYLEADFKKGDRWDDLHIR